MVTSLTDTDIHSTDDSSSSTDSESEDYAFEEYTPPPAGGNEIQPYRFEPTAPSTPAVVERNDNSAAENVSRLGNMDW